jgi:hypothetical protein
MKANELNELIDLIEYWEEFTTHLIRYIDYTDLATFIGARIDLSELKELKQEFTEFDRVMKVNHLLWINTEVLQTITNKKQIELLTMSEDKYRKRLEHIRTWGPHDDDF